MAYSLSAIIGKEYTLHRFTSRYQHATLVCLSQGMALIPLTKELSSEISVEGASLPLNSGWDLSSAIENEILKVIGGAKAAYIESEFFGGIGGHTGIVWEQGNRVMEAESSLVAANEILSFLGVTRKEGQDEFDTLGLGRFRQTEDWIQ